MCVMMTLLAFTLKTLANTNRNEESQNLEFSIEHQ